MYFVNTGDNKFIYKHLCNKHMCCYVLEPRGRARSRETELPQVRHVPGAVSDRRHRGFRCLPRQQEHHQPDQQRAQEPTQTNSPICK